MTEIRRVERVKASGTSALALTSPAGNGQNCIVREIRVTWDAAATTSEDLTITLDSASGAAYDCVLYSVDPSVTSATAIVYAEPIHCLAGDGVDVAYTNTDGNTVSCEILAEVY